MFTALDGDQVIWSDGEREDPQIAPEGQVLHVFALDRKTLLERQLPAAVDLHRSGHAGLHGQPKSMLLRVAIDKLDLLRPRGPRDDDVDRS